MTNNPPAHRHENPFDGVAPRSAAGARSCSWAVPESQQLRLDAHRNGGGSGESSKQRTTERLVRRFLHAIESGSTSAIWAFFARDGAIEFPFLGTRYTDFASFDAAIGPAARRAALD